MIELLGYHVVLTTHNSRISQRMRDFRVRKGPAVYLDLQEEIILTKIISDIINEGRIRCCAYNICSDHVHLLLVCMPDNLAKIIQKLKSVSSRRFHLFQHKTSEPARGGSKHLWSQKFYRAAFDQWKLAKISNVPGELYRSNHQLETINYIRNNRRKHGLPHSEELQNIIDGFVVSLDVGY